MQRKATFKTIILTIFSLGVFSTQASELEIPNTFVDGEVTSASEMNANFEAIKAAVNDNHSQINSSGGESRSQFIGFSATKLNGAGGIFAMQQACHNLSANSHVCDNSEISGSAFSSSAMSTIEGDNDVAWMRLKLAGGEFTAEDGSWGNNINSQSCKGWGDASTSLTGAAIYGSGANDYLSCEVLAKVACCR